MPGSGPFTTSPTQIHVGEFGCFTTAESQVPHRLYRTFREAAEAAQLAGHCGTGKRASATGIKKPAGPRPACTKRLSSNFTEIALTHSRPLAKDAAHGLVIIPMG